MENLEELLTILDKLGWKKLCESRPGKEDSREITYIIPNGKMMLLEYTEFGFLLKRTDEIGCSWKNE